MSSNNYGEPNDDAKLGLKLDGRYAALETINNINIPDLDAVEYNGIPISGGRLAEMLEHADSTQGIFYGNGNYGTLLRVQVGDGDRGEHRWYIVQESPNDEVQEYRNKRFMCSSLRTYVIYDDVDGNGGSIQEFVARSHEKLVDKVSAWDWSKTDISDGMTAQAKEDPDDVINFYPNGKVYVLDGGELHPMTFDDMDV